MSAREPRPESGARRFRILVAVAVAVIVVIVAAVVLPLVVTSTPEFFSRYHLLERRYVNLEESEHAHIGCRACHETDALSNGLELVADYYTSFVRTDQEPENFNFKSPTREACLSCHEDDWSSEARWTERIPHPAHDRVASEMRNCVDCHKWTAHLEPYLETHKEMPFSGVCVAYGCHVGTKTSDECFDCHHVLHEDGEQWQAKHPGVVENVGQNSCIESCHQIEQCQLCHTTGERPEFTGQPIEIGLKAIEEEHVKSTWMERHGAESLRGPEKCLRCHETEAECDECHLQRPAFHGSTDTWIGRHKNDSESIDDPGCLACHEQPWCEDCHQQFKEME